jgi:hypothetical protein
VFMKSLLGTLPILQNAGSRLAVLWNKTEMSSKLNQKQADEGNWRRRAINPLITRSWQETGIKWLAPAGVGPQRECLCSPANQERLVADVTVGSPPMDLWESWGSSCLACCYGSPVSQAGRSRSKVPLSCVEDFSVKWSLGKWGWDSRSTWVTWARQDWGIPFFTAILSLHAPWFRVSSGLCALWAWISLSTTGCPHLTLVHRLLWFQGLTLNTRSHRVVLADWQGRNEVTWRRIHLLIWHHFFSGQQGILNHGNECLKKLPWVTRVSWCSLNIGDAEMYFT